MVINLVSVSITSDSSVAGVRRWTADRPIFEAGKLSWLIHDNMAWGVRAGQVQCDEIWPCCYSKRLNAPFTNGDPEWAGDI